MATFDTTTAMAMTRALSSLLASATDAEIENALLQHAVPRIRMYLLASTDPSGNNIFYTVLSDLSDTNVASAAEALVDGVMNEPTVSDAIRRIAAAFACAWLIVAKFSVMDSQQKQGQYLEKQALADLERLTKGHLLSTAVSNVVKASAASLSLGSAIYIATSLDETTIDTNTATGAAYAGAQLPYVGAPDAGRASIIVNGVAVSAAITAGDAPITIANKLVLAFQTLPTNQAPNAVIAASEVVTSSDSYQYQDADPVTGLPTIKRISYVRQMARIDILPKNYDNVLDVAVASIMLESRIQSAPTTYAPGISGVVYGTQSSSSYLTHLGPHAIAVDLKTGKVTSLSNAAAASSAVQPNSDCLFFLGTSPAFESEMTYRVDDSVVYKVIVPAGSTEAQISELLAQDIASRARDIHVLAAVRPSCTITVNGTTATAPGLEFVSFEIENTFSKHIFHMLSVPTGITFGVVPNTLITAATFDERPKSVVITTTIAKIAGQGSGTASPTRQAEVYQVTHKPTPGLANILKRLNSLRPDNTNYGPY